MDPYDVMYLTVLKKLVIYHNNNLVFEGTLNDIQKAKDVLMGLYDKDTLSLDNAYNSAYDKLEELERNGSM